ncbi:MAG: hypothetical protein LBK77_05230 [Spirochaetaceae bacterium]|jgi:hypothetical protein|nr:hypothetical protein [Spirochaetaceae bacterium]
MKSTIPFRICLFALLIPACLPGVFAIDVDGKAPTITGGPLLQYALDTVFENILHGPNGIGSEIMGIDAEPEKLLRSFADASVFSSSGATQRAFEGYDWFAFTVGAMGGVVLPGSKLNAEAFSNIGDTLKDKGDVTVGANIQVINAQIGVNTSAFLLENLYLGLKFGYFGIGSIDSLTYSSFQIGAVGSYLAIRGVAGNRFSWRGLSVGSGLIYQRTNLSFTYSLDSREEVFTALAPNDSSLTMEPELALDMTINTFTVPLEVNTSFQILFFNFNLGLGVDLAFGKNHTTMDMAGPMAVSGPGIVMTAPGYLTVEGGGDIPPSIVNPKLMMNLGFKFGPVILDIPFTYYFLMGYGLNLGVTLGVVF